MTPFPTAVQVQGLPTATKKKTKKIKMNTPNEKWELRKAAIRFDLHKLYACTHEIRAGCALDALHLVSNHRTRRVFTATALHFVLYFFNYF